VETELAWRRLRTLTLLLGLYCLAAGLYWGIGWEDPFQGADPEEMSQVAAHPKKGLALFVMRYWPWLLMLFGAYQGVKALSYEKTK
jgi:hypothetical protein